MPALTSFAIGGLILGEGAKAVGQVKANRAQAAAEQANAQWLDEQAEFARQATVRELDIFNTEAEQFIGRQISGAGAGGVELSGSALLAVGDSLLKAAKERTAIEEDGRMKVREAALKAGASREQADRLTSFWNNALPIGGSLLSTGATIGLRKS